MKSESRLQRFLDAQESSYPIALTEIQRGKKQSHWMWYIFPQIKGLGFSSTSAYYAIEDLAEAEAYLNHPVLGSRLVHISEALLALNNHDATRILGNPDDLKLKSSMTLFANLPVTHSVFQKVLDAFYKGEQDTKTLKILGK
ncbi:DUF1810 domain-containing protein [Hymenobacter mucosus]|uniref:Uncharacterized protein, DUF1810 family n=1 Tax=Hymenobacter mucosus TaxID=1411120 RepID=A0A239AIW7_9BACT|nr:DUF1810 domain-containing protein [Hymenobacter mucosus]SNR95292.1 Uncharacterized protein, DUF1810 family [Hymenobacter mucosus]